MSQLSHGLDTRQRPPPSPRRCGECEHMTSSVANPLKAFALIALGLAIAAMGIYVANADDAPGAAVIGFLLMLAAVLFAVRAGRNRLPIRVWRAALAVGVLVAAFAAFLTMRSPSQRLFSRNRRTCRRSASRRPRHDGRQRSIARGRRCARPSWRRTYQVSRSRSASAGTSYGPKVSDGGTSLRTRPSHRLLDSTSAPRRRWSRPPRSRRSA